MSEENMAGKELLLYQKEKKSGLCPDAYAKQIIPLLRRVVEEDDLDMRDEVLCAFGFMVIAIDEGLFEAHLPHTEKRCLNFIKKYKKRRGMIPGSIEDCSMFKHWCDSYLFVEICEFFEEFMERVLKNVEKREGQRIEEAQKETLGNITRFIRIMVEHCMRTLDSAFTSIVYMEIWDYVFRFVRSIGIVDFEKSKWFYKDGGVDYSRFFTAVMVGLLAMEEAREGIVSKAVPVFVSSI